MPRSLSAKSFSLDEKRIESYLLAICEDKPELRLDEKRIESKIVVRFPYFRFMSLDEKRIERLRQLTLGAK